MASRIREMFSSSKDDPVYPVNYAQRQGMNSRSNYAFKQHHGPLPVIELRVPMCCEKCKEKVQEELEEMEGVKDVICDQFNQRVTVTGYADPLRVLKRVKKVKKKSEFFTQGSYIDRSTHVSSARHNPSIHPTGSAINREVRYTGQPLAHSSGHPLVHSSGHPLVHSSGHPLVHSSGHPLVHNSGQPLVHSSGHPLVHSSGHPLVHSSGHPLVHSSGHPLVHNSGQPLVHSSGHPGLTRTNSFGRSLARQPSFGKVAHYDGVRHHDFEARDLQRDYYGVRRMPSFKKHRYHDAEYVSMGDQFTPQYGVTHHVRQHNQRPVLQSQVSFSKLPVRNPYYVKPLYHEY